MKTLILISTLNNEKTIEKTIYIIKNSNTNADILLLDRGSTDHTIEKAKKLNAKILFANEHSYYGSILLGLKFAIKNKYNNIVEYPSSNIIKEIDFLYAIRTMETNKYDMVLGSRYKGDKNKKIHGKNIARVSSFIIKKQISDPLMTFKIYNFRAANKFVKHNLEPNPVNVVGLIKNDLNFVECHIFLNSEFNQVDVETKWDAFSFNLKTWLKIFIKFFISKSQS